MSNPMQGIAPDLFRELSKSAQNLADEADIWLLSATPMMRHGDLVSAVDVRGLCREVNEEMGLLSQLTASKASDIETASSSGRTRDLQSQLDASLDDETGREISSEEMRAEMAAAVESGDEAEIRRVSRLMWTTVAGMDDEEALDFLHEVGAPAVFVAVEATGLPAINAAVDFMGDRLIGNSMHSREWDDPFVTYLYEKYDLDVTKQEEVWRYSKEKLIEFSRTSGRNAKMVLERLPADSYQGSERVAEVYEIVILENPKEFATVVGANAAHAQEIANLLAEESSDETLQEILESLVALTVEGFNPNGDSASEAYRDQYVKAAGVFVRSLQAAGKGISIDWDAVIKYGLSKTGPVGSAVATLDDFIVVDDTGKRRGAETKLDYVVKDLAVAIMAATDPEMAQVLTDHMDMNKPLSEEWSDVPSGDGDEEVANARDRLEEIEAMLAGAWNEGAE